MKKLQVFCIAVAVMSFALTAHARITWSNLPGMEGTKINFYTDDREFDGGNFDKAQTIVIPEQINNVPVEVIAKDSFFGKKTLVSVTLPASVKEIHMNAFASMENVKEIIINSSSLVFYQTNFFNCPKLEKVVIKADSLKVDGKGVVMFKESPNAVVYGKAGSDVEKFAKQYNVAFSPL